jgi:Baseplate J-like protein
VADFVPILNEASASDYEQGVNEALEAQFEGIEFAEGDPFTWLKKAFARIGASIFDMASLMSKEAFKKFGETVVSVPPIQAAPATASSTWTMVDNAGYTVPAGTQVAIEASGDLQVGFIAVGDTVVAPGATTATITLQAVEAGEAENELSADPTLIDALAFVSSIALDGVTTGGVDAEEEDAYLGRLVETFQLVSRALILPRDFEIDGRSYPGIARVKCIRNYNPADKTTNNPLMQCAFPVTDAGLPVGAPKKEELLEGQQDKLVTDVIHHVEDPEYTTVDVAATFAVRSGFDPATVVAAVQTRLADYLSPANWGLPGFGDTSNSAGWENQTKVYRFELISEVDRVGGVDRVITLLLGGLAPKAFNVVASTDKFGSTAHGFSNGDSVVVRTGLVNGAPLAAGVVYYVRDSETNAFKLTATEGGAAINITSDGSGVVVKITASESITLPGVAPLTKPGSVSAVAA